MSDDTPTPSDPHQNGTPTMTATATKRSRWAVAAAALLLAPALLTACSSGGASGGDSTPTPKADSASTLFSCMRDKGYDMPDPAPGQRGINLEKPDGVDQDQFNADFDSCASKEIGAGTSNKAKAVDPNSPEWKKTVSCVRDKGFGDFPDDPEALTKYEPSDEAAFTDAMDACSASAGSTGAE